MPAQKLKIMVLREDCIGDGACCDDAPGTFEMAVDGICHVKHDVTDDPEVILHAARSCPTDAIVVVDEQSAQQLVP
jgi:ferredoxin